MFGGEVGSAIPYAEDHRKLVVCVENSVHKLDLDTGGQSLLAELLDEGAQVKTRINDGKCDARGRLWTGTMPKEVDLSEQLPENNILYCYSMGELSVKISDVAISNGIAWTADSRTMFYNDSIGKTYVFDYDLDTATISTSTLHIRLIHELVMFRFGMATLKLS